jgi:uncharacterized membrane protein YkvA (DUF1232 family)
MRRAYQAARSARAAATRIGRAALHRSQERRLKPAPAWQYRRRSGGHVVAHIDVFRGWAETIRQDIDAFKALLESSKAEPGARQLAAAALSYQVSRMDLVPDWNEGIGVLDDVMVLRVCAQLTQGCDRGTLATPVEISLERMANEADKITGFVGGALYDKLRAYCARLVDHPVRGRTPAQLAADAAARKALYAEIDDELKRTVPIVINDPVDAEVRLKAYLTHKLR